MRVLHITPEAPGRCSGGKMGVRQTLLSLTGNGYEVDYVGPEIEDQEVCSLYSNIYVLEPSNNVLLRIYDTFHRNTNRRYRSWLKLDLNFGLYDAVVMDFTKLDYVLKKVPKECLIVRVHNVEADYSDKNFQYNKTLANYLDKVFSGIREKLIVREAQKLIVLTDKDKKRLTELYQVPDEKMVTVPVCIEDSGSRKRVVLQNGPVNMILTGSLWFGPNYEGIKWFFENVYNKLDIPKKLIIAGAKPNEELMERVRGMEGVSLIDSPDSMEPFFSKSDIAIAPVFDGAGMKVKVAEALSYGLPVVGTDHAFEGYHIEHKINSYRANRPGEFIQSINHFYNLSIEEKIKMKINSYELFQKCYSQQRSSQLFGQVLCQYQRKEIL